MYFPANLRQKKSARARCCPIGSQRRGGGAKTPPLGWRTGEGAKMAEWGVPRALACGPGAGPPREAECVRNLITQDEYFPDLRCFYSQLNILNSGLGKNSCVDCSMRRPGSSIPLRSPVRCGCLSTDYLMVQDAKTAFLLLHVRLNTEKPWGCSCPVGVRKKINNWLGSSAVF